MWQRERLAGDALERQLAYWRERLAGAPALLELPADRRRPRTPSFRGGRETIGIPRETVSALEAVARREGATIVSRLIEWTR